MKHICSICLDEVAESLLMLTNCGHVFDTECLMPWLNASVNCPICRENVYGWDRFNHNPQQPYQRVYLSATSSDDRSNVTVAQMQIKLSETLKELEALKTSYEELKQQIAQKDTLMEDLEKSNDMLRKQIMDLML
ncbi:hypothetical protein MUCCIDRAFT_81082 [Mucor lusitanicus CBS 277.49]|uniref:RING-type domain-containing protein n=1 Tax=Mucor lusitanicus CBS 277.49 TaxID=747725 RepID=A0A168L3J3_MUCCL|nr:hypothetical protein MUCCIDRAFT_81082 [Mucor lusitanicus CBS 277.49]